MAVIKKIQIITSITEDTEKWKPSYTADENINWCSRCATLITELPRDPAIPFAGVFLKELKAGA